VRLIDAHYLPDKCTIVDTRDQDLTRVVPNFAAFGLLSKVAELLPLRGSAQESGRPPTLAQYGHSSLWFPQSHAWGPLWWCQPPKRPSSSCQCSHRIT